MSLFPFAKENATLLSSSPAWTLMQNKANPLKREEAEEDGSSETGNVSERADTETEFSEDDEHREGNSALEEDGTASFFRSILVADPKARRKALKEIISLLKDSLKKDHALVRMHLARIVRFATEVPFRDIAEAFRELIDQIELTKDETLILPKPISLPSTFIPKSFFPSPDTTDPQMHKIFVEVFVLTGRISHLNRVLLLHPSFFEKYFRTFNFIMRAPGPLPFHWRNYIAILSAARSNCGVLIDWQEAEFQSNGGDKNWLRGFEHAPAKIKNLMELIQLISHRPWLLSKKHVQFLVTQGAESWSIGELVHAMVIICTFKALSGIVWGCGVTPEVDFESSVEEEEEEGQETEEPNGTEEAPQNGESVLIDTSTIMKLLQSGYEEDEQIKEEQQEILFDEAETVEMQHSSPIIFEEYSRYIGPFTMKHADFDVKSKEYSRFRVQDYHWKEHGYDLFRRFLPDAAALLDEEFDHIYHMTYRTFTKSVSDVDTLPLRRAVWQYVQRIRGMFHDDYNYQEVNKFLNRAAKLFIKKVTCSPEMITVYDFSSVGIEIDPDEKVHIALLAVESARQSELLYGLHAVMQHMNNR